MDPVLLDLCDNLGCTSDAVPCQVTGTGHAAEEEEEGSCVDTKKKKYCKKKLKKDKCGKTSVQKKCKKTCPGAC